MQKVAVIGAGSWGTALALVLARDGRPVSLLTRSEEQATVMRRERENTRYLPGIPLPENIDIRARLGDSLDQAAIVLLAVPCAATEAYLARLQHDERLVIATAKGLTPHGLERMDQLLVRHLGRRRMALLSGPSFALEVARGKPTAITMAAHDLPTADYAASFFTDRRFRIYRSDDPAGVAIGGSLKNVIAIAAGIAEDMHLGHNAMATLVTRGICEISRFAVVHGARADTISGLSGLGDLVLTCTGGLSRNRRFGMALARGMTVEAARTLVGQVVEGERTAHAVCRLAREKGIDMPIAMAVQRVLRGELSAERALQELLARPQGVEP